MGAFDYTTNGVTMHAHSCMTPADKDQLIWVYSGADQRKHQSSASLAFVQGIHRRPMNFSHKWLVTRKNFPFDDVIMCRQATNHYLNQCWPSFITPYGVTKPRRVDVTRMSRPCCIYCVVFIHARICIGLSWHNAIHGTYRTGWHLLSV